VDYPGTGTVNTLITGINNSGRLVGYFNYTSAGPSTAFIASPQ